MKTAYTTPFCKTSQSEREFMSGGGRDEIYWFLPKYIRDTPIKTEDENGFCLCKVELLDPGKYTAPRPNVIPFRVLEIVEES